jgi:PHD/YefM family antitoxin component YafN of YafNO toxin-antitoxin module
MASNGTSKLDLATVTEHVRRSGERFAIRSKGRIVAAVVSAADLKELEDMDRIDARLHRQAMARARKRGEKPIPLAQAKKMLGL